MQPQSAERRAMRARLSEARARKRLVPRGLGSTLLLVEDDTEMRRMLAAALRRDGHFVIEAANGDEALDWLAPGVLEGDLERVPDLIVSDIRLPYFSGLEILEGLQVAARRIPVILITGFPDRETHARAAALGAVRVLEKPFDLGELRAAVHAALAGRVPSSPGPDHAAS
jgi:DNA-binding response OmpR family regulator